jgi:hypothetical protein
MKLFSALQKYLLSGDRCENNREFVERVIANRLEIQTLPKLIGTPIEGTRQREYDGHRLFPIRYPRDSATKPDWSEINCPHPLEHVDRIGTTGLGPNGSVSVGFDVDTLEGHASGITNADRDRISKAVEPLEYVEVRRSSGGEGLHLFVLLEGFNEIQNHTQHAALARAVCGVICHDAQLNFAPSIDVMGGNLWFYRSDPKPDSYKLLKAATRKLTPADVPNWRDHIEVVTGKRSRVQVNDLDTAEAASYPAIGRDDEHERILAEYRGAALGYLPDHKCYQAHTAELERIHKLLNLAGAFETDSHGDDPGKPNCFLFLRPNGGMFVVRYGTTSEHPLWDKTAKGHPCIAYNVPTKPEAAARAVKAICTAPGRFTCSTFECAKAFAKYLGIDLPELTDRPINFTFKHDSVTIEADRQGKETPEGYGLVGRKLRRLFQIETPSTGRQAIQPDIDYDKYVRHLVTPNHEDAGWLLSREDGSWGRESKDTCKDSLVARLQIKKDATATVAGIIAGNPYTLVVEPLQPVWLSGRRCNLNAKRLIEACAGEHPHYDMILNHIGRGLDDAVAADPWCIRHGVARGADYLRLWAASMVQRPKQPLPYTFLWSLRNDTGKSAWHRSMAKFFEGGATDVHRCLTEKFNSDLAGMVLGYIEDKGLDAAAYERLKGWVDAPTISIRAMHCNAFTVPNYGHYVHTANSLSSCPLLPHDKRVVVIEVDPFEGDDLAWGEVLSPLLDIEAPAFLATLLSMSFPPSAGRLFLPVLETESKRQLMGMSNQETSVVDALTDAVERFANRAGYWTGYAGQLLAQIGGGPWSANAGTMSQYLSTCIDQLQQRGVTVSIASTRVRGQRLVTIAQFWLWEPESTEDEIIADEIRIGRLV